MPIFILYDYYGLTKRQWLWFGFWFYENVIEVENSTLFNIELYKERYKNQEFTTHTELTQQVQNSLKYREIQFQSITAGWTRTL